MDVSDFEFDNPSADFLLLRVQSAADAVRAAQHGDASYSPIGWLLSVEGFPSEGYDGFDKALV